MAEIVSLTDGVAGGRARRRHPGHGGVHAPHPVRGRPRDHPPGTPRPHARAHDARSDLRPADRHGMRDQAHLLVGRQPRRRIAAPLPRRRRERLAAAARARGAQPRGDGQPLPRRRERAAVRRAARLRRHRPSRAHRHDPADHLPVHRRGAHRGAGAVARRDRSFTRSAPTGRATCRCGASSACRRRRCSRRSGRSSPSRRSSTASIPSRRTSILPSFATTYIALAPGGAHPSYAQGYSYRDNAFYTEWDGISRERETFLRWMDEHVLRRAPAA